MYYLCIVKLKKNGVIKKTFLDMKRLETVFLIFFQLAMIYRKYITFATSKEKNDKIDQKMIYTIEI